MHVSDLFMFTITTATNHTQFILRVCIKVINAKHLIYRCG